MTPKTRGFTLVEIMFVVVFIGLLLAMAIPAFNRVRLRSKATAVVNNLRQFSGAFEQYTTEQGVWPAQAAVQVVPAGMTGFLPVKNWIDPLPGGHRYEWDVNTNGIKASVSILPVDIADKIFTEVDSMIDDGDTTTGRFRFVTDRYMLIIEE